MTALGYRPLDGSEVQEIVDVLYYEAKECGNDIFRAISSIHDIDGSSYKEEFNSAIMENDKREVLSKMIEEISSEVDDELVYALWLWDNKSQVYNNCTVKSNSMEIYEKSEVILIDLGERGRLYAYSYLPESI